MGRSRFILVACVLLAIVSRCHGLVRTYYIASQELVWDYIPTVSSSQQNEKPADDRIGNAYHKAAYFQYTDQTFTEQVPKPNYSGILGPVIAGEVGDVILVHFFNNASRNFSIHPHGVFYEKGSEGAIYLDGTSQMFKLDDGIPAGGNYTYRWEVTDSDAPTSQDPVCLPWVYHSHVNAIKDVSSGLIGVILTCKKGILNKFNQRTDVQADFPVLAMIWNENLSWYLDKSSKSFCSNPEKCRQLNIDNDQEFIDSNLMKSLNGLAYGTLPGLQACFGDRVVFYVIGFGNEADVHSLHFHGQNVQYQHTRGDTLSVYTATFVAAETTPTQPGRWLISDMVGDFQQDGIFAYYSVRQCGEQREAQNPKPFQGTTRRYYLAVEQVKWNYAPTNLDLRTGNPLPTTKRTTTEQNTVYLRRPYVSSIWPKHGPSFWSFWRRVHSDRLRFYHNPCYKACSDNDFAYTKAKFVEYEDEQFRHRNSKPEYESHMGILGPVIGAEEGDRLFVTLKNRIQFPVSFLAHGVTFDPLEESLDGPGVPGGAVGTNQTHTYRFEVPVNLLEGSSLPCKNFLYTSAHDPSKDRNAGLVGPLLICRRRFLSSKQRRPKEFFISLSTFDEGNSLYSDINKIKEPQLRFNINGYVYGNLPDLDMCLNEQVTWYVMSVGSEMDVHTVTFDGNTFTEMGTHRDGRHLVPGGTATLSMLPDNEGRWMLFSQSNVALDNGMFAFYNVYDCGHNSKPVKKKGGETREYFIAAEEVMWDYTPLPRSIITGSNLTNESVDGGIFLLHNDNFIGHVYKKAVFKEYTDTTFRQLKTEGSLDILGPAIMAEVGDTVKVTFRNNARRPYSIHTHGAWTSQENSGVNYGSASGVLPGRTFQYVWQLTERSGPGPNDPNCIPWLYYSSVDPIKDTNTGLLGPLIVCRKGTIGVNGKRRDIDKELFIFMSVMNENLSWYLEDNIKTFAPARVGTNYQADSEFDESNKMHSINGRLHGNNQGLVIEYGQKVVWYMMSLGAEIDLHTIHIHGHTFVHSSEKHRDDVIQMFPGMAEAVEMVADNPGTWLLHCHVIDHIFAGMETVYTVLEP
ncbi:hephaestin-like protein 1, partial [Biomphalaria glabrata]